MSPQSQESEGLLLSPDFGGSKRQLLNHKGYTPTKLSFFATKLSSLICGVMSIAPFVERPSFILLGSGRVFLNPGGKSVALEKYQTEYTIMKPYPSSAANPNSQNPVFIVDLL